MDVDASLLDMMGSVNVEDKRTQRVIETPAGSFHVSIDGNPSSAAIVTLHEIGLNSETTWDDLSYHPSARILRSTFCLYNINIPGQHAGCEEYIEVPRVSVIIESLGYVLRHLGISNCVGMGYGAGAYIMTAFANRNQETVLALILINAVTEASSCRDYATFNPASVELENYGMTANVKQTLFHYYGGHLNLPAHKQLIAAYDKKFQQQNSFNLSTYLTAFARRSTLALSLKIPILSIYGSSSPEAKRYQYTFAGIPFVKVFEVPNCTFPLAETTEAVAEKIVSFLTFLAFM